MSVKRSKNGRGSEAYAPTSFLDFAAESAALKAESETEYQKFLPVAQPAAEPTAPQALRRAIISTPAPKPLVTRAANPRAGGALARRVVKRTKSNRTETAEQAAPPPPPAYLGGNPLWRQRAGLPELPEATPV